MRRRGKRRRGPRRGRNRRESGMKGQLPQGRRARCSVSPLRAEMGGAFIEINKFLPIKIPFLSSLSKNKVSEEQENPKKTNLGSAIGGFLKSNVVPKAMDFGKKIIGNVFKKGGRGSRRKEKKKMRAERNAREEMNKNDGEEHADDQEKIMEQQHEKAMEEAESMSLAPGKETLSSFEDTHITYKECEIECEKCGDCQCAYDGKPIVVDPRPGNGDIATEDVDENDPDEGHDAPGVETNEDGDSPDFADSADNGDVQSDDKADSGRAGFRGDEDEDMAENDRSQVERHQDNVANADSDVAESNRPGDTSFQGDVMSPDNENNARKSNGREGDGDRGNVDDEGEEEDGRVDEGGEDEEQDIRAEDGDEGGDDDDGDDDELKALPGSKVIDINKSEGLVGENDDDVVELENLAATKGKVTQEIVDYGLKASYAYSSESVKDKNKKGIMGKLKFWKKDRLSNKEKLRHAHDYVDGHAKKRGFSDRVDRELSNREALVLVDDKKNTVTISFKGTNFASYQDVAADYALFANAGLKKTLGFVGGNRVEREGQKELREVDALVKNVRSKYKGRKVIAVGHSLGGAKALYAGRAFDIKAVAFNPGPLGVKKKPCDECTVVRTRGDLIALESKQYTDIEVKQKKGNFIDRKSVV